MLHPTTITGSDFYDEFSSGLLKENAEKGLVVFFSSLEGWFILNFGHDTKVGSVIFGNRTFFFL